MIPSERQNPFLDLLEQASLHHWCTSDSCDSCELPHLKEAVNELSHAVGRRKARRLLRQALIHPNLKPHELGLLVACASQIFGRVGRARLHLKALRLAISSFDPDLVRAVLDRIPADWPLLRWLLNAITGGDISSFGDTLSASRRCRIQEEEE